MTWLEALLPFRARNNFEAAALLAQSKNLLRLAAAWPRVKRTLPAPPGPEEVVDLERLWVGTRIDFIGWGEMTGLHLAAVLAGFKVLQGNQVIFPDGTVSHLAEALIKKQAAGKFLAEMDLKPGDLRK
ncbi:MAG: hypothetical protein PHU44_13525 [Syntrophales bacterium]|nr:hypothetical protein [Syntrophales bacterium]MDD5641898.1 hypothetical protein [Syntrophales bacterium]